MSESDADELECIREKKRQELLKAETGGTTPGTDAPDEPIYVDGPNEFDRLVGEHDVALVDFYADWCGPCQMLGPILDSVAANTQAAILKVNTDQHAGLARDHGVQGLPTLLLFADGQPVERLVGVQDEATLSELIARHAN